MKIDGRIRRMDSMMLEANIRKLSRMELIYTCIAKLVRWLEKNGQKDLIKGMEHYCDPNDFNQVIYQFCRSRSRYTNGNTIQRRRETVTVLPGEI